MKKQPSDKWKLLLAGVFIGVISIVLVAFGNPKNMGFCVACFLRDIAGGVGLHSAAPVQYIRPEIIGIVLGAFFISVGKKEYKARGGSSPALRFVLGFVVMVGALMFLGCPLRMVLRLAGGDLNALLGIVGFAAGILAGVFFLKKGFTLGKTYPQSILEGAVLPITSVGLLVMLLVGAGFLVFSESGPGSMHAPIWMALLAGLAVGVIAQRTRLCMVGGIRDVALFKDFTLLLGFVGIFIAALAGNVIMGYFKPGFEGQPIAHTDWLWNFLGMAVVGLGSVLLGGCPMRQLILAGEGNSDSTIAVLGMVAGAAFCHNFKLASSADGPTANGKIAVLIALAILGAVAVLHANKIVKKEGEA